MIPDLEGLEVFIRRKDRSVPPHYAGRQAVLANIEGICSLLWREHMAGQTRSQGMTRVIYGAPGAGKSSTLKHLERKWQDDEWCTVQSGPTPLMLYLGDPVLFARGATLTEQLDGLLRKHTDSAFAGAVRRGRELAARLMTVQTPVGGVSIGKARQDGLDDPVAKVLKQHPPARVGRPLVIAIDEFQTMSGDMHAPHASLLRLLHQASYDAPIMLVLAGLGDTVAVADRLGISRLAQDAAHSLGCFAPEESADLIAGWGSHFDLPDGTWQVFMRGLAAGCDHWPVHVQNTLLALAEEIVFREGAMERLDMAAVRRRSGGLQENYYASRMSPEMQKSKLLLAAVMADLRPGMDGGEIMDAIGAHAGSGSGTRWRLPKGMDEEDYFGHLVHRGALQADRFGNVSCPIPSFRRYMAEPGQPDDHAPPLFGM